MSFDLTGPEAPEVPKWLPTTKHADLEVFLLNVTDETLTSLLPVLPDIEIYVIIAGEQWWQHRLTMYSWFQNKVDTGQSGALP